MLGTFGTGVLLGTRNDIAGQTPEPFAILQGVDFDFGFTTKPLFGLNQFAVFVARAEGKWTGKAKYATISLGLMNAMFFGQTLTTGGTQLAANEAHTVPAITPFVVTPTNINTYAADQGVQYVGLPPQPLTLTSGAPGTSGLYEAPAAATTGAYTFNSLDASAAVLINYLYTVTTGQNIALSNLILGTTPTFKAVFRNRDPKTGLYDTLIINQATSGKLAFSSKTSDYTMPELDFEIFPDANGNIGTFTTGDLS
jgi:hypothetical protein